MKLFQILQKRLQLTHLYKPAKAGFVLAKFSEVILNHFGEESKKYIQLKKFNNQKIFLTVSSSVLYYEIFTKKITLLRVIQSELPQIKIEDILISFKK